MTDSMDSLRQEADNNGGVLTTTMLRIRNAYGAKKLGIHVRTGISNELRGLGLGHYPDPLPDYQEQPVRIYKMGSPVADLIDAALHPSNEHDRELREASGGNAEETIQKIRELVCE